MARGALALIVSSRVIQVRTSERSQPIRRPRYWHFLGNLPTSANPQSIQLGRRVRRATSCALRMSCHAGSGSFTQRDSATRAQGRRSWELGLVSLNSVFMQSSSSSWLNSKANYHWRAVLSNLHEKGITENRVKTGVNCKVPTHEHVRVV